MNLLKSHPGVVCFSEVFFQNRVMWASKIYGHAEQDEEILALRNDNPSAFLDKHIYRPFAKGIEAVGYKLHYKDMNRFEYRMLTEYIDKNPDTKVIHLKRYNHLDRLISTIITERTSTAVMHDESAWEKKLYDMGKITLDPNTLQKEFAWCNREHKKFDEILKDLDAEVLQLDYKQLTSDNTKTMQHVQRFLRISPFRFATTQRKQNSRAKNELVSNYTELKAGFANTEWKGLFDE